MRLFGIQLARLNHILIPSTKAERDRARRSIVGRLLVPLFWLASMLTREGRAYMGLLLLIGAAGVDVGNSHVYMLFVLAVGAGIGSLLIRPLFRLPKCSIRVFVPQRVVENEPVTFGLDVLNDTTDAFGPIRIEGPFLPWDGRWTRGNATISAVGAEARVRVNLSAKFSARGEHHLDPFTVAALTPLALVQGRVVPSADVRFVVIPQPAEVVSFRLGSLEPADTHQLHQQERLGDAQLASVRPYRFGDSLRKLHVRTWARTGQPHVKEFLDEGNQQLCLVFEASGAEPRLLEASLRLCAGVVALLSRQHVTIDSFINGGRLVRLPKDAVACEGTIMDLLASIPENSVATDSQLIMSTLANNCCVVVIATEGGKLVPSLSKRPGVLRVIEVTLGKSQLGSDQVSVSRIEQREVIAL